MEEYLQEKDVVLLYIEMWALETLSEDVDNHIVEGVFEVFHDRNALLPD